VHTPTSRSSSGAWLTSRSADSSKAKQTASATT
jgi:hypothetical protein